MARIAIALMLAALCAGCITTDRGWNDHCAYELEVNRDD